MNERIKELKQRAGIDHNPDQEGLDQFAELIVGECISTLNEMHVWQSVNNQNYPSAWHDAIDAGIKNIKQHFGVKE